MRCRNSDRKGLLSTWGFPGYGVLLISLVAVALGACLSILSLEDHPLRSAGDLLSVESTAQPLLRSKLNSVRLLVRIEIGQHRPIGNNEISHRIHFIQFA